MATKHPMPGVVDLGDSARDLFRPVVEAHAEMSRRMGAMAERHRALVRGMEHFGRAFPEAVERASAARLVGPGIAAR